MTRNPVPSDTRLDALSLALIAGAAAITAAVYGDLPARVPTHFDLHGRVDGWSSRAIGAWLLPVTALGTWALVRFGAAILPRGFRERMAASPVRAIALLTSALFVVLQLIVLWAAFHEGGTVGGALSGALGAWWVVLAQVLPRVRRNPFIGVRTAWTLTSDENWARTHRFASVTFTVGGVVAVLAAIGAPRSWGPSVAIVAIVASALLPLAWSFVIAHRLPPEG